jgi:hypothetical protein
LLDFSVDDLQKFALGLALILPGAVIIYVRSLFLTGRRRSHAEEAFSYVVITCVYFAIALPIIYNLISDTDRYFTMWLLWVVIFLVAPVVIGVIFGISSQQSWLRWLLAKIGLKVVHPVPTAWDWKFGERNEHWLIITLKNETKFLGYYGQKSFASSDGERDIYMEQVFEREGEDDEPWKPLPQGLWVQVSEISTIEFLPVQR